jgi:creatinine amidohydrolase
MTWLQEMRWPEVREYLAEKDTILLPVGSTEQHARHAPLGTDSMIAIRLAEDASRRSGVISAPPLWFGWSPHHMVLPGTISIRPGVLEDLLFDAIQSLAHHGFAHFVVVNGHRITNIPWIQLAAQRAQSELKVQVVIFDPGYMEQDIADELGFGPLGHAEELETSQLLHLFPEMVDLTQAVDSPPHTRPLYQVDPRYRGDTLCYVPSTLEQMQAIAEQTGGSTGQPSKADASSGARLHQHLVERLIQVISTLE